MSVTETIYGQVVAKANHYLAVPDGHGGRRITKDPEVRLYEQSFAEQCRLYRDKRISVKFRIVVRVFHSSMRYDLDNSIKTVLDCLQQANAITDDNLCFEIRAEKHIDKRIPRVEYSIQPLQEQIAINLGV